MFWVKKLWAGWIEDFNFTRWLNCTSLTIEKGCKYLVLNIPNVTVFFFVFIWVGRIWLLRIKKGFSKAHLKDSQAVSNSMQLFRLSFTQDNRPLVHSAIQPFRCRTAATVVRLKLSSTPYRICGPHEVIGESVASVTKAPPPNCSVCSDSQL